MDTGKDLKRKNAGADNDDRSTQSEKKKRKKDGKAGSGRPKYYPLSERQQLALLMQMTAEENNEQSPTPPPTSRRTPGGSGKKDKVNKRNERGETPLHIATIRGELPLIMDLVKQGADVNVQDYAGWTPLHEACNHGYQDIAEFLLEAGAIVNSKGFNDDYPLHDAVMNEHVDLVKLLLKHGANPLLSNKQGERPLDISENVEIKELMKQEVLSSDESDQSESKLDTANSGSCLNSRGNSKANKPPSSGLSRELFKQVDDDNFKNFSSFSDSDDSDDVPLSRRRRTSSVQSRSSTTSSLATSSTHERKISFSGYFETKRSKGEKKRRLFSSDSSESHDSDAKLSRDKNDLEPSKQRSSADDFYSHNTTKSKEERSTSEDSAAEKKSGFSSRRPTITISSPKGSEADVYDFSPTADDFSSENTAISLKPDGRATSKWDASSKASSLFSRKPSSIFSTKGFDFGAKKSRKPSKDYQKDASDSARDSVKSALIKPVHDTSAMLFDKLFKSPLKDNVVDDDAFWHDAKTSASVSSSKTSGHLPLFSTSTSSLITSVASSTVNLSSNTITYKKEEHAKSPVSAPVSTTTNAELFSGPTSATSDGESFLSRNLVSSCSDATKNIFTSVLEKTYRSSSIDNASLLSSESLQWITEKPKAHTEFDSSNANKATTLRAFSVDDKPKQLLSSGREPKPELTSTETKAVRKLKIDIKDKLSKTVSDPVKKPKTLTKDAKISAFGSKKTSDGKTKLMSSSTVKKDGKAEPKKVSLLPDAKSNFLSALEKSSLHQQRKRLVQKKVKSTSGVKQEEKKQSKKSEVKLIETDSWLGSPLEKSQSERTKKALQRSMKRNSDSASESNRATAESSTPNDSDTTAVMYSTPSKLVTSFTSPNPFVESESSNVVKSPRTLTSGQIDSAAESEKALDTPPISVSENNLTSRSPSSTQPDPLHHASPIKSTVLPKPILVSSESPAGFDSIPVQSTSVPTTHDSQVIASDAKNESIPSSENGIDKTSSNCPPDPETGTADTCSVGSVVDINSAPEKDKNPLPVDHSSPDLKDEEEKRDSVPSNPENDLSPQEKMLRSYIQKRLDEATIELSHAEPLPNHIPLQVLLSRKKNPSVDKLNVIEERLAIQRRMFEKRKKIVSVVPRAPNCYWEYMTFTGGYLLNNNRESRLSVPVLAPPPSLSQPMIELFKAHEEKRVRLRVQHAIQREKLIISCEQEIMRVYNRAARTNQNQMIPFSACVVLMDCEVYSMPRQPTDGESGKTSVRDRFNARMFLSWLQDVDDKFGKIKVDLLTRQRHEAAALHAVQKIEWILKCQELDRSQRTIKPNEINEIYVPVVNIADNFDLLPT